MCLRSRCVAVRWIQPSDLYVTIEDCSSPSAEPPVPATVHWRQRAAFTSRTRDWQSSYNPQLCCVRAHSNVVRRSLGHHSSTRAQTRGACSPASPGKDTAIFSETCGIILTTLSSRHPTRPAAAVLGRECNIPIFVLPSPSDACAPLPAGEDRRRAPTRFVREARGATRVARASAEPACWPSPGPPPGPRGRRFDPPGSKRAVLTPPSGAFVDPTSSRSSAQKYLFTRSLPQVKPVCVSRVQGCSRAFTLYSAIISTRDFIPFGLEIRVLVSGFG